jgi:signal transduction histidine kinase
LPQIARDLLEEASEAAAAAGLQLRLVGGDQGLDVLGVESELYRLVSNLLLNALQYTPPGGEVALSLGRERGLAVLQVQDSGIGISPADQQRIFDRFFRSDPGRSRLLHQRRPKLPVSHAHADPARATGRGIRGGA